MHEAPHHVLREDGREVYQGIWGRAASTVDVGNVLFQVRRIDSIQVPDSINYPA